MDVPRTKSLDISHWNANDRTVIYHFDDTNDRKCMGIITGLKTNPEAGWVTHVTVYDPQWPHPQRMQQSKVGTKKGEFEFVDPSPDVTEINKELAVIAETKATEAVKESVEKLATAKLNAEQLNGQSGPDASEESRVDSVVNQPAGHQKTSAVRNSRLQPSMDKTT